MCSHLLKPNWYLIIDSYFCRKVSEAEPRPQFHLSDSWYHPLSKILINCQKNSLKVGIASNYCNSTLKKNILPRILASSESDLFG